MKSITLITPAFLSIVLACIGCGGSEAAEESTQEAASASQVKKANYGYEMIDDLATGPAQPAATPPADFPAGRLAPELVQSTVRGRFNDMRACYEAALQQAPTLAGKVTARFKVQEDGTVIDVKDNGSTITDATMVQCVMGVFSTTTFPTSSDGVVDVIYPIEFSPGDD